MPTTMPGSSPTIVIDALRFTYPGIDGHPPPGSKPLIDDFSLTLNAGDRCLLVGSNGAGKTTILKILGGKHMVEPHMVRVLGRSAFHDTALTVSGDLCYLGGEWRRDVAFAGFEVPIQMAVSAEKLIFGVGGVDPQRRAELINILDIDLSWTMHKVSDGQRRRVQICMGLLKAYKRTVESWLRKERDEERKKRRERKASGLPEFEERIEESRVTGDPARAAVRVMNNGWAAGRLHSTVAGEENFLLSSNRVLRQ
ncbi:ABC transporter I family member 20 [Cucurbita argyrosperma subsp. argyrosperma]|nr:ABC transporter I family member 20 [Cucurbita argyrosperma subsp. argyrosperma]